MYSPHVLAMDVGQEYKVITSDQTAHNIHPRAQSDDREYSLESVAAAGSSAHRAKLEERGSRHPGEVQHPSLDARILCRGKRALRDY